jgi:hypothetical protein
MKLFPKGRDEWIGSSRGTVAFGGGNNFDYAPCSEKFPDTVAMRIIEINSCKT